MSTVRPIRTRRAQNSRDRADTRVLAAQLTVSTQAMARLLSVSGTQTDFILSSADGSTTIRVGLLVSTVSEGEQTLGKSGVILDWTQSTMSLGRQRITLSRMELRLLAALLEHAPRAVSRKQLTDRMWPSARVGDANAALPVWVFALRRRFAALGLSGAIRTVRNTGYALAL